MTVGRIDPATGEVLRHFEARDTSGALVVPDWGGRLYLTLSAAASSIAFYGVNPQLPGLLQVDRKPQAGFVALDPRRSP